MISITSSSLSYKCRIKEHWEGIKITSTPVIGKSFIQALVLIQAFAWGVSFSMQNDPSFGIISTIMLVVFIIAAFILEKKVVTINHEILKAYITGWSEVKKINWTSDMELTYERMFNESDKLSGIRLYLSDEKGTENTLIVLESENSFQEFIKVYHQKYPTVRRVQA